MDGVNNRLRQEQITVNQLRGMQSVVRTRVFPNTYDSYRWLYNVSGQQLRRCALIFRARSRERSQLSLSGLITEQALVGYNNRSLTQNYQAVQMPPLLQLQKSQGKGDGRRKKSVLIYIVFRLTRKSRVRGKNAVLGILQHEQQIIACCQTHSNYGPSKKCL